MRALQTKGFNPWYSPFRTPEPGSRLLLKVMPVFYIVAIIAFLSADAARAVNYTFTGNSMTDGSDWFDTSNWQPAGVPGAGDSALLPAVKIVSGNVSTLSPTLHHSTTVGAITFQPYTDPMTQLTTDATLTIGVSQAEGVVLTVNNLTIPDHSNVGGRGSLMIPSSPAGSKIDWSGGYLDPALGTTIAPNAVLNMIGTATKHDPLGNINNMGTTNLTGSGTVDMSADSFSNSGIFNIQNDFLIMGSSLNGFINQAAGVVNKSITTGVTTFQMGFNNNGTVNLNTGTLALANGGTSGGAFNIAPAATLDFVPLLPAQNTSFLTSSASFTGAGFVRMEGGPLTLNGNVTIPNLQVDSGTLYSSNTIALTVTNLCSFTGGFFSVARCTIAPGATLNISGSASKTLSGILTNLGVINLTGSGAISGDTINNGGVFNAQTNSTLTLNFNNLAGGVFNKSPTTGTTTITGSFNNSGTLNILTGILSTGAYTQTFTGLLNASIGGSAPGTGFGQLIVNGKATLAGGLSVGHTPGFLPGAGSTYQLITYNSLSGSFTGLGSPNTPYNPVYNPNNLTVTIPNSSWRAVDTTVGSDNKARLLWNNLDGHLITWSVDNAGTPTYGALYGPYSGWSGKALAAGADGLTRLLWTNVDGSAALWLLDASGTLLQGHNYGPYPGWTATDVTVSTDNIARILWTHVSGQMGVWSVDNAFNMTSGPIYGPYLGFTAVRLAAGPGSLTYVLWNKTDSAQVLWIMGESDPYNNVLEASFGYGPYPGYTAIDVAVGSEGQARLLWLRNDGVMTVWSVNSSGAASYGPGYGPYIGFAPEAIAVGADGLNRVLWGRNDFLGVLWLENASNSYLASFGYGPY